MNPKISIIVPVYNAELYLNDCLNSIRTQIFDDYEAILIDDGSTDGSLRLIESVRVIDERFQVFHQGHCGVSAARNMGIRYAKGDYLCFVDADDLLAPDYLEGLYLAIVEQVDSSMCGFKKTDSLSYDDCTVVPHRPIETRDENLLGFFEAKTTDWQRYLWNRMFKRKIIIKNNLCFREDIYYKEDGLFVVQYLCASNGLVGCIDKVLYYYRRNSTGSMSKTWHAFDEKLITNLKAHRLIIEEIKRCGVSDFIISKALSQAKAACNWILISCWESNSFKLSILIKIEKIMVSILGIRDYLFWRTSQFIKFLK